jgi:hypothetical protein
MGPVKTFNNSQINSFANIDAGDSDSLFFEAASIMSGDFDLYSGKLSVRTNAGGMSLTLSAYAGAFGFSGGINEFSGALYGGSVRGSYDFDGLWMDATAGFTISKFKTGMVFDGSGATRDPVGVSAYGAGDIGTKFAIGGGFHISPFVGIGANGAGVLHQSEFDIFARMGAAAGFGYNAIGIKSDYRIYAAAQTDNAHTAGIRADFLSVADGAGGGVSYGIIRDSAGLSHKISANLNFSF